MKRMFVLSLIGAILMLGGCSDSGGSKATEVKNPATDKNIERIDADLSSKDGKIVSECKTEGENYKISLFLQNIENLGIKDNKITSVSADIVVDTKYQVVTKPDSEDPDYEIPVVSDGNIKGFALDQVPVISGNKFKISITSNNVSEIFPTGKILLSSFKVKRDTKIPINSSVVGVSNVIIGKAEAGSVIKYKNLKTVSVVVE